MNQELLDLLRSILSQVITGVPTAEGTYTLKVVISAQGIPTFSWTVDE